MDTVPGHRDAAFVYHIASRDSRSYFGQDSIDQSIRWYGIHTNNTEQYTAFKNTRNIQTQRINFNRDISILAGRQTGRQADSRVMEHHQPAAKVAV